MKKLTIILLNYSFLIINCYSQTAPGIQWQNTIGGNSYDWLYSISPTADGGYICGGFSTSDSSGDKTENSVWGADYWVVKLDSMGNIQWQNTIGGSGDDELYSISQTADGGYICGGYSDSDSSGDKTENSFSIAYDYWVLKLDSTGKILWQNTIGGYNEDRLYSISPTIDKGYICGGWSASDSSGDKTENCLGVIDYWVVKLDSAGSIQWQNTIGGSGLDELYSIQQTTDGGYILGGHSSSDSSGDKTENNWDTTMFSDDLWIVKLDSIGKIQWQNTIGGNNNDWLLSIYQTVDGGFICGGTSASDSSGDKTENCIGNLDYWIVKTDSLGNIQWQNTIGGSGNDALYSIQQASDGGYILGGWSESNISGDKTEDCIGGFDYWIVKTDASGSIEWENTIGGNKEDWLYSISPTADGGFICGGWSYSNISGDKTENNLDTSTSPITNDYWVIKLYPNVTSTSDIKQASSNLQLYPNPAANVITISSPMMNDKCLLTIYDLYGRDVYQLQTLNSKHQTQINVSTFAAGIYFIQLHAAGKHYSTKLIVEHD